MMPHVIDNNAKVDVASLIPHVSEGRRLWDELFEKVFTEEDLTIWDAKVKSLTCKCDDFYQQWKKKNPPTFPLSLEWKWMLKSAVNEKIGKPNLSWEEVRSRYSLLDLAPA